MMATTSLFDTDHFNFCRLKNSDGYFLIPNFRFVNDNIVNTKYNEWKEKGKRWKETVDFIYDNDTVPFDNKENKFYFCFASNINFH